MNILQLKEIIDRIIDRKEDYELEQLRVVIPIKSVGSVGGTPCVDIKSVMAGFDWDNGKWIVCRLIGCNTTIIAEFEHHTDAVLFCESKGFEVL